MKRWAILWLLAIVVCAAAVFSRTAPPNIVLIVIDTLRADRLGANGNGRGLTPFIDSLAARGYVFRNAYAQCSWTNPSVASIMTSRFQSQHGIVAFESVLADSEVTLAEVLKQRGYVTGFFSANGLLAKKFGFAQGYDEFQSLLVRPGDGRGHPGVPERAARINGDALAWLDRTAQARAASAPVFLHLHYMEPHYPYAPRAEALDHVADGHDRPDVNEANAAAVFGHVKPLTLPVLGNLQDVYDAEVLSIDTELRALFAELERRHFLDHAIVVLTADHGEEFMEHDHIGHEQTLFQELVRVPLLVLVPGHSQRTDVDQVVSLIDVAPTLVDLAGAPRPPSFEGHSWKGTLVRDPSWWRFLAWRDGMRQEPGAGFAYSELIKPPDRNAKRVTPHEHAVVWGSHKLIVGIDGEREFYDLAADPGEKDPNGLTDGARTELQARYEIIRARAQADAAPQAMHPLDAVTRERMHALGYDQ
jgi:arylsulfatase A-like enzyme